jgi:hypothetical protein
MLIHLESLISPLGIGKSMLNFHMGKVSFFGVDVDFINVLLCFLGMWPAHWMLSDFYCWSRGSKCLSISTLMTSLLSLFFAAEIDIMENLGHTMDVVYPETEY